MREPDRSASFQSLFTNKTTTLMEEQFESSKDSFRIVLAPIFDLLMYKKLNLGYQAWLAFVAKTESSIVNSPEQFLGNELPGKPIVERAIREIFTEYMAEESVEA